jgi:hypothetical protein
MCKTKTITVWERWNKKLKTWEHNHIDDDYDEDSQIPIIKFKSQEKIFKNAKWRKTKAKLVDQKVVK